MPRLWRARWTKPCRFSYCIQKDFEIVGRDPGLGNDALTNTPGCVLLAHPAWEIAAFFHDVRKLLRRVIYDAWVCRAAFVFKAYFQAIFSLVKNALKNTLKFPQNTRPMADSLAFA